MYDRYYSYSIHRLQVAAGISDEARRLVQKGRMVVRGGLIRAQRPQRGVLDGFGLHAPIRNARDARYAARRPQEQQT